MSTKFEYRSNGFFFPTGFLHSRDNQLYVDWVNRDYPFCRMTGYERWEISDYKIDPIRIRDFHLAFRNRVPGTTLSQVTEYLEELRRTYPILACHEQ